RARRARDGHDLGGAASFSGQAGASMPVVYYAERRVCYPFARCVSTILSGLFLRRDLRAIPVPIDVLDGRVLAGENKHDGLVGLVAKIPADGLFAVIFAQERRPFLERFLIE